MEVYKSLLHKAPSPIDAQSNSWVSRKQPERSREVTLYHTEMSEGQDRNQALPHSCSSCCVENSLISCHCVMPQGDSSCRGWGLESGLPLLLGEFSQTLLAIVGEATLSSTVRRAGFHELSHLSGGLSKDSNGTGGGWNAKNKPTLSSYCLVGTLSDLHCPGCTPTCL